MSSQKDKQKKYSRSSRLILHLFFSLRDFVRKCLRKLSNRLISDDEDIEIFNLAVFVSILLTLSSLLSFAVGYSVAVQSEGVPDISKFAVVLGFVSFSSLFGFSTIKERVSMSVKKISKKEAERPDQSRYSFEGLKEIKHSYYLSRIACDENFSKPLLELAKPDISQNLRHKIWERGHEKVEIDLGHELKRDIERRKVKCILHSLSDKAFFHVVALQSAQYALGIEDKSQFNTEPESLFLQDIYLYMKAWMICSIDNYHESPMPLSPIGLNYPSKDSPQKALYRKALQHLSQEILQSKSAELQLNSNRAALNKIRESIDVLIDLINKY